MAQLKEGQKGSDDSDAIYLAELLSRKVILELTQNAIRQFQRVI